MPVDVVSLVGVACSRWYFHFFALHEQTSSWLFVVGTVSFYCLRACSPYVLCMFRSGSSLKLVLFAFAQLTLLVVQLFLIVCYCYCYRILSSFLQSPSMLFVQFADLLGFLRSRLVWFICAVLLFTALFVSSTAFVSGIGLLSMSIEPDLYMFLVETLSTWLQFCIPFWSWRRLALDTVRFMYKFVRAPTSIGVTGAGLVLSQSYLQVSFVLFIALFCFGLFNIIFALLPCELLYYFILFYGFVTVATFHVSIYGHVSSLNGVVFVVICAGADAFQRFVAARSGR